MKNVILSFTLLALASPAFAEEIIAVRGPNPNCTCESRPDGSIDLVRVRDGKIIWTYASDIWPMDVCIADRESLPACQ